MHGFIELGATVLAFDGFGLDVLGAVRALLFNGACPGGVRIAEAGPDQQEEPAQHRPAEQDVEHKDKEKATVLPVARHNGGHKVERDRNDH